MQRRYDIFVHAALNHQVVADDRMLLSLPVKPLICLLVDLQRPVGVSEPDGVVSAGL